MRRKRRVRHIHGAQTIGWRLAACAAACVLSVAPALAADCGQSVEDIEAFVRDYYRRMETLTYDQLRVVSLPDLEIISMSLPEYEIFGEGLHIGHDELEKQIDAAKKKGRELQFQLTQFNSEASGEVAWTSYMMYEAKDDQLGLGEMILRCKDDRWMLARLVHTAFLPGYPE